MRPGVMLVGFVLGSAGGIAFSLFGVLIVYLVLRRDYPRFAEEVEPLVKHLGLFVGLTTIAALTFYAELRQLAWRAVCRMALFAALASLVVFYWPGQ
jgi:hypothetical protein